ncbi:unnamed protein product [Staurois parvus]|uniref:Uncharacterized protein n=1 Tax=Staurois parvus TaxID=386267 RepID=A0ABN9DBT3_9NEOB|nr:unnamed protein product [Staurois parvus]
MIGTSYRGPVRQSVFHCVRRTQRVPDCGAARSQGARTSRVLVYKWPPNPAVPPSSRLYAMAG